MVGILSAMVGVREAYTEGDQPESGTILITCPSSNISAVILRREKEAHSAA